MSVITTESVAVDTYAGLRCLEDPVLAAGTVIVNFAVVAGAAEAGVGAATIVWGVAGARTDCAPLEHPAIPPKSRTLRTRMRWIIESAPLRS